MTKSIFESRRIHDGMARMLAYWRNMTMSNQAAMEPTPASKLLLVDDEPVIVDALAIVLKHHGYDCTVAYHGLEAIEKARQLRPQFILMGVVMPGMYGTEAGRIILDEQPDCKMFFFSGWKKSVLLFEDLKERGYTFGIMPKPLHPRDLLKKLSELGLEPSQTPPSSSAEESDDRKSKPYLR